MSDTYEILQIMPDGSGLHAWFFEEKDGKVTKLYSEPVPGWALVELRDPDCSSWRTVAPLTIDGGALMPVTDHTSPVEHLGCANFLGLAEAKPSALRDKLFRETAERLVAKRRGEPADE